MTSHPFERSDFVGRGFGVVIGLVFAPIGAAAGYVLGLRGLALVPCALLGGIVAGFGVSFISRRIADGAGAAVLAAVQPSGNSSPYTTQYSQGLALEARDDVAGAKAWFAEQLRARPDDPRLLVVTGDLHARHGGATHAEQLYLRARSLSRQSALELYCTQRLIDLRLGTLGAPHRALPELRRLVDQFPGTREADGARAALTRLKAEGVVAREGG